MNVRGRQECQTYQGQGAKKGAVGGSPFLFSIHPGLMEEPGIHGKFELRCRYRLKQSITVLDIFHNTITMMMIFTCKRKQALIQHMQIREDDCDLFSVTYVVGTSFNHGHDVEVLPLTILHAS